MKMMTEQQCLEYVAEHKLRTYHNETTREWNVTDEKNYIGAPTFDGAVNIWKARYDAPDTQGDN